MGTKRSLPFFTTPAAQALFPQVRQRVLAVLFATPQRSFYTQEIITLAQSGNGAVQRELQALVQAGLLSMERHGNQTHYQVRADAQGAAELCALVQKTLGLTSVLHAALEPLLDRIDAALVVGAAAANPLDTDSAVEVLVVSDDVTVREVQSALRAVQGAGPVSARVISPAALVEGMLQEDSAIAATLRQPRQWLVGSEAQWQARNT